MTEKTKAVVVNHYGGYACDMEPIVSFCRQNGLYLIEDCATAFGTVYRGQLVGTFGDLAAFSFNDKKDLCTGEGGALTVNDSGLWDRAAFRVSNGIMRTGSGSGKSRPVWIGAGFSNIGKKTGDLPPVPGTPRAGVARTRLSSSGDRGSDTEWKYVLSVV